jgi:hypothetical protein
MRRWVVVRRVPLTSQHQHATDTRTADIPVSHTSETATTHALNRRDSKCDKNQLGLQTPVGHVAWVSDGSVLVTLGTRTALMWQGIYQPPRTNKADLGRSSGYLRRADARYVVYIHDTCMHPHTTACRLLASTNMSEMCDANHVHACLNSYVSEKVYTYTFSFTYTCLYFDQHGHAADPVAVDTDGHVPRRHQCRVLPPLVAAARHSVWSGMSSKVPWCVYVCA